MKFNKLIMGVLLALTPLTALNHPPPDNTQHCLAEAIWREAGSENTKGKRAVAQVVLNRVAHPHYPDTVCGVVFQKSQFSWTKTWKGSWKYDDVSWKIAGEVLAKPWKTFRATHFHNNTVSPDWNLPHIATIGNHIFYEHKANKK